MRQFFLQNEAGERIYLQNTGESFFHNPDGLGAYDDITYMQSDDYFFRTRREPGQMERIGTLTFFPRGGGAYAAYKAFADWVYRAQKITMAYCPAGDWYYMDVDITRMDKGELGIGGCLDVPIAFAQLTPIYAPSDVSIYIDAQQTDDDKIYTYSYSYRYPASAASGDVSFSHSAQIDSDFDISFLSPISGPVVTITREDTGATLGVIDLSELSVAEGERATFSTAATDAGLRVYSGGTTQDRTNLVGINQSYPTYFRLPPVVTLKIKITAGSLTGLQAVLTIRQYYRTV